MSEQPVPFPVARRLESPLSRFFADRMRLAAPANANEGDRAVLFDVAPCFGAMPISCGPAEIVRRQRDIIAATGDGWYADMPPSVRATLRLNGASLRIVVIPAAAGEWPEIDAAIADLFDRSGLPPDAALARMARLEALVARIGAP